MIYKTIASTSYLKNNPYFLSTSLWYASYSIFFNSQAQRDDDKVCGGARINLDGFNLPYEYLYSFFTRTLELSLYKYYIYFNATRYVSSLDTSIFFSGRKKLHNKTTLTLFDKTYILRKSFNNF